MRQINIFCLALIVLLEDRRCQEKACLNSRCRSVAECPLATSLSKHQHK